MELINENIKKLEEFNQLITVLKDINENKKTKISYDEVKEIIIKVIKYIMVEYLKESNLDQEEIFKDISIVIKELPKIREGSFEINKITINESVIKQIYNGDLLQLTTIFHELNHFKVLCDLINSVEDICLYRILKENLLERSTVNKEEDNLYYKSNYHLYSEEIYVEIKAIYDYLKLLEIAKINISRYEKEELIKKIESLNSRWNKKTRDLTYAANFNDYELELNEAFDIEIKYHLEWLKSSPLLQLEYYQDDNGKIRKRTIDELIELLIKEKNSSKELFILEIIKLRYIKDSSIKKIKR